MTYAQLHDLLDQLGLKGFRHALSRQENDTAYGQLSFEERLFGLLEAEHNDKNNRKIKRLLSSAKFKDHTASLEELEYGAQRGLERSFVLSLAQCRFIEKKQNILINGPTGSGKSFLAQALARACINEGYSARYCRVSRLIEEIKIARLDGSYTKKLSQLSRFALLILDDFGVTPLKNDEVNDLFEVIEERTLSGSTIVTAQLPIREWHSYLGNETIADAILDRLVHSSHKIELKGESMRKMKAYKS